MPTAATADEEPSTRRTPLGMKCFSAAAAVSLKSGARPVLYSRSRTRSTRHSGACPTARSRACTERHGLFASSERASTHLGYSGPVGLRVRSTAIPLEITHAMPTLLTKMQAKPRFKLCVCVPAYLYLYCMISRYIQPDTGVEVQLFYLAPLTS